MSWWVLPTTADIGIRAFSADAAGALSEVALGLQSVQLPSDTKDGMPEVDVHVEVWEVEVTNGDLERGLVRWLEEVLYRGHEEGQWLVHSKIIIERDKIRADVNWIDSSAVKLGLEVKAVTLHELVLKEIGAGELVIGFNPDIPSFEGPGWMAQVILDI